MPMLNAGNAKSEDDFKGKFEVIAAGKYHVAVNAAEEIASKNKGTPGLQIEFVVVADGLPISGKGTTSGQSGKTIDSFLSYVGETEEKTHSCLDRLGRLAFCVGLLGPGESKDIDWSDAIGRELVIEVIEVEEEYNGRKIKKGKVNYMGFWSLGNKAVKDVPRDLKSPGMQALAAGQTAGGKAPPVAGNGSTAPQQTAQQPAAAAAPKSKYADL